jgi:hypothetical protein
LTNKPAVVKSETKDTLTVTKTIQTMTEYADSIEASAGVSYSGWGTSAQASFSMAKSSSFKSESVLFVASSRITYGFDGWADEPKFTNLAKSLICDPEAFTRTYGTYFVKGRNTGAYMRIMHTVDKVEDKESFSTAASAGGGGWGVNIETAFATAKSEGHSSMTEETIIEIAGLDREKDIPHAAENDLTKLKGLLDQLSEKARTG